MKLMKIKTPAKIIKTSRDDLGHRVARLMGASDTQTHRLMGALREAWSHTQSHGRCLAMREAWSHAEYDQMPDTNKSSYISRAMQDLGQPVGAMSMAFMW